MKKTKWEQDIKSCVDVIYWEQQIDLNRIFKADQKFKKCQKSSQNLNVLGLFGYTKRHLTPAAITAVGL